MSADAIKKEFLRLAFAIGMVFVSLFGGLIAINRLVIQPKTFGDVQALVRQAPQGRPFASVGVELFHQDGTLLATGRSDEKGVFLHGRLPQGTYRVRFSSPKYRPEEEVFTIRPQETTRLVITMRQDTQEGTERQSQDKGGHAAAQHGAPARRQPPDDASKPAAGEGQSQNSFLEAIEPGQPETSSAGVNAVEAGRVDVTETGTTPEPQPMDRGGSSEQQSISTSQEREAVEQPSMPNVTADPSQETLRPAWEVDVMIERILADVAHESITSTPAPSDGSVAGLDAMIEPAALFDEADVSSKKMPTSVNWQSSR